MMNLSLNDDEAKVLAELLESSVADLRMEIADTDSMKFKEMLKARKALILGILERLTERSPSTA